MKDNMKYFIVIYYKQFSLKLIFLVLTFVKRTVSEITPCRRPPPTIDKYSATIFVAVIPDLVK